MSYQAFGRLVFAKKASHRVLGPFHFVGRHVVRVATPVDNGQFVVVFVVFVGGGIPSLQDFVGLCLTAWIDGDDEVSQRQCVVVIGEPFNETVVVVHDE